MLRGLRITRNLILLAAAASIAAPLCIFAGSVLRLHLYRALREPHVVQIDNQSALEVAEAAVTICGDALRMAGLPPGGSVVMRHFVECSGEYAVRVRLASGATAESGSVPVVWRTASHDVFTIAASGAIRHETRTAP